MIDSAVQQDLAPTGEVRIALNVGNTAVVERMQKSGELRGIAVNLSRRLTEETGLPLRYVVYESAGEVVRALDTEDWDVAFLAIDPARRAQLSFTMPYMQIEGRYIVRCDSAVVDPDQVDSHGVRIGVTADSAYDLYLRRRLMAARLERYPTSAESLNAMLAGRVSAAAGVAAVLENFVARNADCRILEPAFMTIDHGMATLIERAAGARYLTEFLGRQIAEGRVGEWLNPGTTVVHQKS